MFGSNTSLVEEIIKSVKTMNLYKQNSTNIENVLVINDYEKAKFLAYDNLEYEMNSENGYNWVDIRELVMSNVNEDKYTMENYKEFNKKIDDIELLIRKDLKIAKEYRETWDDAYADIVNCAICRAIYGQNDSLFEKLYNVYKSGGWPCGWEGNFPEGKLIAFYPKE
ncbi:hypothetical protein SAMN02745136_05738 [Anaerocolumna jejuensis DSM 15929]|uniref:Cytoplasmic protein n=1 Tax=Anaerocolumna jejuensis DSM 15929 TaxID=1121322 RepID=A0A1M7DN74_9FIRM|nr:hypothetical protein [Anaerocolumna jejuensis]SHL80823.1 hypothetical protein SAMN02745136_05738 [Anaerocolumna jejuensis DSM 15929]